MRGYYKSGDIFYWGRDIDGVNNKANEGVCEGSLGRTCKVRKLPSKKTDKKNILTK
jgi:hypothetical protein